VDLLSKSSRRDGKLSLDAFMWLNKVTLDIIGLTGKSLSASLFAVPVPDCVGFDYTFDSLHSPDEDQNDLYRAIRSLLEVSTGRIIFVLQLFFPIFRIIVSISALFGVEK
jgi:hypothetical protein